MELNPSALCRIYTVSFLLLEVVGHLVGRDEFFLECVGASAGRLDHLDALDDILQLRLIAGEGCDSFLCHISKKC